MKKRGFTLIELLAVIVVLAIIALIATPMVLNAIESARKGAAEQSALAYVKAVENIIIKDLSNEKSLKDGVYNVSRNTTISDVEVNSLNSMVDISRTKPSAGTVTINSSHVTNMLLCINGYVVNYENSKTTIITNDCGLMELIVVPKDLTTETEVNGWYTNRIIELPKPIVKEGYTSFFMITDADNNKIYYNDNIEVEQNKEIPFSDPVSLIFNTNAKIITYYKENDSDVKINEVTYLISNIDNVDLSQPPVFDLSTKTYTVLTGNAQSENKTYLKFMQNNSGADLMYSLDNGQNWFKYTKEGYVSTASEIKAKYVSRRGLESETANYTVDIFTSSLPNTTFNGDTQNSTCIRKNDSYLYLDSSLVGKTLSIHWSSWGYSGSYYSEIYLEDKDGNPVEFMNGENKVNKLKINGENGFQMGPRHDDDIIIPMNAVRLHYYVNKIPAGSYAKYCPSELFEIEVK